MEFIKKLEKGKLLKRKDLMVSQKGQILSTKLAENSLFSLELYSLAQGESISGHNLMKETMFVVTCGSLEINGDKIQELGYKIIEKEQFSELFAPEDCQVLVYTFFHKTILKNVDISKSNLLSSQVDFAKDAVASKVIIQENPINITLFALYKGEEISSHKSSGDALVIPLEGDVRIKIDKEPYDVSEGDIIILPANIPHSLSSTSNYKMFLTVVKE